MVDYFFSAYDVANRKTLHTLDLTFYDLDELLRLRCDFEDDARATEAGYGDGPAPSVTAASAMPRFDPESWVLLQNDPDWTSDDPTSIGSGFATPEALRRWQSALSALDGFVPSESRKSWDRVRQVLDQLVEAGNGLHCCCDGG